MKKFHGAARQGNVRELKAAAEAVRAQLAALDQAVAQVGGSWKFDEEGYLREGGPRRS